MDDPELLARLQAEGLQRAWALFPEDVRFAATLARKQAAALNAPLTPADEPWPPMQPGDTL
jgi:hypothetical protein